MNGSKKLTSRNLKIAQVYTQTLAGIADAALLSGSNAWGADYAVTVTSDIDLLITGSVELLGKAIEQLIFEELINPQEKGRFEIFHKLYDAKKAEQFSTIAIYYDTKVSLDFIPWEVAEKICKLHPLTTQQL
jgi:hypothetical protein